MNTNLEIDAQKIEEILTQTRDRATHFLQSLNKRPVGKFPPKYEIANLPDEGMGTEKTLEIFHNKYSQGITASSGARYFGFVTGGATPAAIALLIVMSVNGSVLAWMHLQQTVLVKATYQSHYLVAADKTILVPDAIPDELLGALWLSYLTAWGCLVWKQQLQPGQTVMITAASSSVAIASCLIVKKWL
ncbi:MAG: hypothetical protein HC820_03345 [Hydrococcus sp. RM1_1_31]|nr:hypothetical protein [Hydrococcus sp. RM1_1_31]